MADLDATRSHHGVDLAAAFDEHMRNESVLHGAGRRCGPWSPIARARRETVIQVHATGPWKLTYVNPADDPRNAAK